MSTIPMMGGQPPMGGSPMQGYDNAGGGSSNATSLYQGYGWNPQQTPMNFGGPYGPMSWPSWNQMSMNAGGLYGAMFNPWLMMQQGQSPGTPAGTPPVANQQTPAPTAPVSSLASPHFAYMTGTGTPTAQQSPAWNPFSVSNVGTDVYNHNAALAHGGPGTTMSTSQFTPRDLLRFPGPQPL